MSARDDLLRELRNPTEWVSGEVGADDRESLRLLDAFRSEALQEASDWLMSQGHTIAAVALDGYIEAGEFRG